MTIRTLYAILITASVLMAIRAEAQGILIDPTTQNGSFEDNTSKATFLSGDVPYWAVWTGVSTADNDSGSDVSAEASNGTRDAYLQSGNADYNLTSYVVQVGDVFTYSWDWVLVGRGTATAQLGYFDGSSVVAIDGTATSFQSNTTQGLGLGSTYTVMPGDPAIGHQIAMTIASSGNYPEVDNFVLAVNAVPEPSILALSSLGILFLFTKGKRGLCSHSGPLCQKGFTYRN